MAIVKNTQTDRLLKNAIVLDLGDLRHQADRIIEHANVQAEAIIEQARQEARRLVDVSAGQGFEEGKQKGLAEGRETGRAEARIESLEAFETQFSELQAKWSEALHRWEQDRQGMLRDAHEDVLRFAFEMAEKIVHRVVEQDPAVVVDQVRLALEHVSRPSSVCIHAHPDDAPLVDEVMPELKELIANCRHVDLREDASVGRGGCIISTEGGQIDATIETQLQRITQTLLPSPSRSGDEPNDEANA